MTDYDRTDIPAGYDRARDHGPETLALWMNAIDTHLENTSVMRILDLGCGTGRFSEALAAHFTCEVTGVDPSVQMLERARAKQRDSRVHYEQGHAEAIPLSTNSVDLVFMSMSLHHFTDPVRAAHDCRRVLRERGRVVLRTATLDAIPHYPYVPFFPSSVPILQARLPSRERIDDLFSGAGFSLVASQIITQTIAPDWTAFAEKLAAGGDSVLAELNSHDFAAGLEAVRKHAAEDGRQPVVEPIDLFVFQ